MPPRGAKKISGFDLHQRTTGVMLKAHFPYLKDKERTMATAFPRRRFTFPLHKKWAAAGFVGLLISGAGLFPAFAGDSTYGTVAEVRSADVVVLDHGKGRY